MSKVRVEFVTLGTGPLHDGSAMNVLREVVGAASLLTVGASATTSGDRPQAPQSERGLFARISALDGNVIAAFGADPAAAQGNGVLVMQGQVELLPVRAGDRVSLIELATV